MIKIVNGNLLDATEDIIGHQVNCQGVMGSGVAKQLRDKYPTIFGSFREAWEMWGKEGVLGKCFMAKADDKWVANLHGQFYYGRDKSVLYTDYEALRSALVELITIAKAYDNLSIALPYNIGCGLANGDWDGVVYPMLEEVFDDYPLTLYRYEV